MSLDLTLSNVQVWRKLINSPAVQILFCYGCSQYLLEIKELLHSVVQDCLNPRACKLS